MKNSGTRKTGGLGSIWKTHPWPGSLTIHVRNVKRYSPFDPTVFFRNVFQENNWTCAQRVKYKDVPDQKKRETTRFICQDGHNKAPQTGWLTQQKCISHHSAVQKSNIQVSVELVSSEASLLGCRWPSSPCIFTQSLL